MVRPVHQCGREFRPEARQPRRRAGLTRPRSLERVRELRVRDVHADALDRLAVEATEQELAAHLGQRCTLSESLTIASPLLGVALATGGAADPSTADAVRAKVPSAADGAQGAAQGANPFHTGGLVARVRKAIRCRVVTARLGAAVILYLGPCRSGECGTYGRDPGVVVGPWLPPSVAPG